MQDTNVVPIKDDAVFPLIPFQDIVIIEQLSEKETASGLILPGRTGDFASGMVVAVGPGRLYSQAFDASGNTDLAVRVPMSVKVGDWVCFGKYQSGGEAILLNGKKYLMAREGDLGGKSASGEPIKIRLSED